MTNASSGPAQGSNSGSAADSADDNRGDQPSPQSFYDVLGLRSNASGQDIRRAYRDLSKLYHPDTTELESAIATTKFQSLNEAYATLSSPEKRMAYDYKVGFSRISVMQPLSRAQPGSGGSAEARKGYSSNAYIDPNDRPLSAGEFFALFILGLTFIACLVLVLTLSLTRDDVLNDLEALSNPNAVTESKTSMEPFPAQSAADSILGQSSVSGQASPGNSVSEKSSNPNFGSTQSVAPVAPELPRAPWLVPKPR